MGKYEEFIAAMQQKYMGVSGGAGGIDGVQLHAVAPAHLRNTNTQTGTMPQQQGMGIRYTGRGPIDQPAGIVDKDEMVVESGMVQKMGGPENSREGMEILADMKEKGMDLEKLKEMKKGGVARSFATGTGRNTAGGVIDTETPKPPEVTTAEDAISGMVTRAPSRFASTTDTAMTEIRNLATGGSDAIKTVGAVATRGLAGQQTARSSALDQSLAQGGVEGGAARVAQAMDRRQSGIEQTKLRSDLEIENQQRMERANTTLAQLGLQGEQAEEVKHQFDVGVQKWGKEFEESGKRFGAEYALNASKFDYSKARDTINDFLNAGDFEGAAGAYKNLGININMDQLKNTQTATNLANVMVKYNNDVLQFGPDSPQAKASLGERYKIEHPDLIDSATGLPKDTKAFDKWLTDATGNAVIAADPIRSHFESIGAEGLDDMAFSFGYPDIETFEFNGVKGAPGFKNAMTAMARTGGLSFTEDGFTFDKENPLYKTLMKKDDSDGEPGIVIPDKFKDDPLVKDAPKGAGFVKGQYGNAFVGKDGTVTEITAGVGDVSNRAVTVTKNTIWDGTNFKPLIEGDTFYVDSTFGGQGNGFENMPRGATFGGQGNGFEKMPRGAYRKVGDTFVNLDDGKVYGIGSDVAPAAAKWYNSKGDPITTNPKPGDTNEKGQRYTKTKGGGYWK